MNFGISQTDSNLVINGIDQLLNSGKENPYSLERILGRRKFGREGAVGQSLDRQLQEFKGQYLELMDGVSKHVSSPTQTGALREVLGAGSVSSQGRRVSFERSDPSVTSGGSYNIPDPNSSAKKRWFSSFSFSGVKDLLAKICGSSKKEDSLHSSVTAEFVVYGDKEGAFALTEKRIAREQKAQNKKVEEEREMKAAVLKRQHELQEQRSRKEMSERRAQKSQAPEQRGPSMLERGWSALKNFRGPEALVVTTHQRKDKDRPWKKTSQTEIRPEDLKNGAIAAVRGVRSTVTGGAATVAENVGAGVGFMASGWKDGDTYPSDAVIAAARFMIRHC